MTDPIIRNYSRKTHKKCIKCRQWLPREPVLDENGDVVHRAGFGKHNSSDGLQSICYMCKNTANNKARNKNVTARLRHHISTRCLTQLGDKAPEGFTADLEKYLGYTVKSLVVYLREDLKKREGPNRSLRDALNEGYHVDHIRPLSSFPIWDENGDVIWGEFQACWAVENLTAIPAAENLAKGAKYDGELI